jgi:hypothetical protein
MIGLSFAEQSMLARIQVVICFSTLPDGSQKAKGSAGFIDKSDFAMQVATRLPWHPSTIPYLALLNETPGANPDVAELFYKYVSLSAFKISQHMSI